jgi:hypothetical protein
MFNSGVDLDSTSKKSSIFCSINMRFFLEISSVDDLVHDYFNKNQIFIKKVYDFSDVDGISGH